MLLKLNRIVTFYFTLYLAKLPEFAQLKQIGKRDIVPEFFLKTVSGDRIKICRKTFQAIIKLYVLLG